MRDVVPNGPLDGVVQKELERMGPPAYDAQDLAFARALQKELGVEQAGHGREVQPYAVKNGGTASSDIGEVSAVVPLSELNVATRPLGTVGPPLGADQLRGAPGRLQGNAGRGEGPRGLGSGLARRSGDGGRREGRLREGHRRKAVPVASAADAKPQASR